MRKRRVVLWGAWAAVVASCGSGPTSGTGGTPGPPTTGTTSIAAAPGSPATGALSSPSTAPEESARAASCRPGDPLADVYHPYRLDVREACLTVTGTVAYIRSEDDGDIHLNLALPAGEKHLLDARNYSSEDGELVAEIVPADQPGCTPGQPPPLPPTAYRSAGYSYGTCTGADLATPPVGSQVRITGPYVLDSDHGWMEIHPVWSISVMSTAPASPPPTTASPPPEADTEPAPPAGNGTAWCAATASPSNDGYPDDYQVYVRSDQPDTRATASDSGDTWSQKTDSSGYADIRLYHTSAGMRIAVTVGSASCSTVA